MKVVLAEKPSVARDIAHFLKANSKKNGYFEGANIQVTWAFGHLVSLKEPHEYDPSFKRWELSTLPILPEKFALKLVSNAGAKKQFQIIKSLFKGADELICATDAGREGELIFRYIQILSGSTKKPFKRLWLNSLTTESIRNAFNSLKDGKEYQNLFYAAQCRSQADWIVGLNATRFMTVKYGFGKYLWSVGRVQTPILQMIAKRDEEIRFFVSSPFWELKTLYKKVTFEYKGKRFQEEKKAKELLIKVKGHPLEIADIKEKKESVQPPLLFDLTDLQKENNKRFGLSAQNTLDIVQELYEKKWITYPRTDSRYLNQNMKEDVVQTLRALTPLSEEHINAINLSNLPSSKRVFNDSKVTDHHAIIPTGKLPKNLSLQSMNLFQLILNRFISAFFPPCLKLHTTIVGKSNGVIFNAKGVQILDPGWTRVEGKKEEKQQELPKLEKGESGSHAPFIKEGKTKAASQYTENLLLGAMETAGKQIEDEELKDALKNKGLGTAATRASIIETLLTRGYIKRVKKNLLITDLGRTLIAFIKTPTLKSPEMTGEWEYKLKNIEQGKHSPHEFMDEIKTFTKELISAPPLTSISGDFLGSCPLCKSAIIKGKKAFGCSNWKNGCKFVLPTSYKDIPLSESHILSLMQHQVCITPINLPDKGAAFLKLTSKGDLDAIPLPQSNKKKYTHKKSYKKARK